MSERLLTAAEVADYLHLHPNTVRRLVKRGDLPAFRIGTRGDIRVRSQDVVTLLMESRQGVTMEELEDLG